MKYILTIDQSTFSTKVFIIDEESNMLASSSYQHQQYYPQNAGSNMMEKKFILIYLRLSVR